MSAAAASASRSSSQADSAETSSAGPSSDAVSCPQVENDAGAVASDSSSDSELRGAGAQVSSLLPACCHAEVPVPKLLHISHQMHMLACQSCPHAGMGAAATCQLTYQQLLKRCLLQESEQQPDKDRGSDSFAVLAEELPIRRRPVRVPRK